MSPELSIHVLAVRCLLVGCLFSFFVLYTGMAANATSVSPTPENLLSKYWNWWLNLPADKDVEEQSPDNQCLIHKEGTVIFLLDPFQLTKVTQTCTIPSGSSVFFPFYIGWCDNGLAGFYGEQSYDKILACALDADRGVVKMTASLDGNKIIDLVVDNKDVNNLKIIRNNLPNSENYKVIRSLSFFNLTVTNATQYTLYEKPEEFQSSPAVYKAVGHCFCGIVQNLSPGSHIINYQSEVTGSEGVDDPKGWNYKSDITYNLKVT